MEAESLLQQISTLQTQDGEFVKWYLISLMRGIDRIPIENTFRNLYLPFSGNDPEAIIRLFKGFCLLRKDGFIPDENNIDAINTLAEIAAGKTQKKGLVLRGEVGTGKTFLISEWIKFRKIVLSWKTENGIYAGDILNFKKPEVILLTPTIILSAFTKEGFKFFDRLIADIFVFDDLAAIEPISYFGNNVNLTEKLIIAIYEKLRDNPNFEFYATTDVLSDVLSSFIGDRAFSRLSEMAMWKEGFMKGSDRRRAK